MKIYIAGKITGNPGYKEQFAEAERMLQKQGHLTMNPAVLSEGFAHSDYMHICYRMIDVCEGIFLLDNWRDSVGATIELHYAQECNKVIMFQSEVQC